MKLLLLLFNVIPFLQILGIVLMLFSKFETSYKILIALSLIYLLPPLLSCLCKLIVPIRIDKITFYSKEYYAWWFQYNLQVLYLRLPFLEEVIRIVPGAYSMWLRLWGSKIGKLVYWAPGLRILDRSFLDIGDLVVFGADVKLNPHVIQKIEDQNMLLLGPIKIGKNVLVGGYSLLTAGVNIGDNESMRAFSILTPFSRWSDGRRIKPEKKD